MDLEAQWKRLRRDDGAERAPAAVERLLGRPGVGRSSFPGAERDDDGLAVEARSGREAFAEMTPGAALLDAVRAGDGPGIERAVAAGANPNVRIPGLGEPVLHVAVRLAACTGDRRPMEVLLRAKADPTVTNGFGESALHEAAAHGASSLFEPLLARGADPLAQDFAGRTAQRLAYQCGHGPSAERLAETVLERRGVSESAREEAFSALPPGRREALSVRALGGVRDAGVAR